MITERIAAIRRASRRLWLQYEIYETEAYLADCARDGLIDSLHLREWRGRLAQMRIELAMLQEPLASPDVTERTA